VGGGQRDLLKRLQRGADMLLVIFDVSMRILKPRHVPAAQPKVENRFDAVGLDADSLHVELLGVVVEFARGVEVVLLLAQLRLVHFAVALVDERLGVVAVLLDRHRSILVGIFAVARDDPLEEVDEAQICVCTAERRNAVSMQMSCVCKCVCIIMYILR